MKLHVFTPIVFLFALSFSSNGQCSFNPTVSGDSLLCPGDSTVFSTQEYDSYQWFRRVYPDGTPQAINGATGQNLTLGEDDILYYYWVEATDQGCTEASPQVLLDGLAFLLPFVSHEGDYVFDPELEAFKICTGDTMFLIFSYNTNITWFRNGVAIPEADETTLAVTEPGAYTVEGAPAACPNYIQPLGLVLDVVVENCATPVKPSPELTKMLVYPNPVDEWLTVENSADKPMLHLEILNATGQTVREFQASSEAIQQFSMENMASGIYFLRIRQAGEVNILKIMKI